MYTEFHIIYLQGDKDRNNKKVGCVCFAGSRNNLMSFFVNKKIMSAVDNILILGWQRQR